LVPVKVADQVNDAGEVRVNAPADMVKVPVIVQLDPAGTAPPHAAASAGSRHYGANAAGTAQIVRWFLRLTP